jgi:hypothetical protein
VRMMQLRSYHSSVMAALWACLPWSPAWVMALPFGIWALRVLGRREVQIAFGQPFEPHERAFERPIDAIPVARPATEPPQPTGPVRRGIGAFVGSMYSLMFHSRVENPTAQLNSGAERAANPVESLPGDRAPALSPRPMAMRSPPRLRSKGHAGWWVFGVVAVILMFLGLAFFSMRMAPVREAEMARAEAGSMVILGNRYRDLVTTTHLDNFGFGGDVRKVFQSTEAEYLALESRFTKRERKEGNRVLVTIGKFSQDVKELETLFLNKLQNVTNGMFTNTFRQQLENKIFPFGSKDVRIELWQENGLFHGKVTQEFPEEPAKGQVKMIEKTVEEFSGPDLPPMYKRFWIEPAKLGRSFQSVGKK